MDVQTQTDNAKSRITLATENNYDSQIILSQLHLDLQPNSFIICSKQFPFLSRFRRNHNNKLKGISEDQRSKRRKRNLVTMKFNMINWMIETVSIIMIVIVPDDLVFTLYILLNSCATPLVYIFGMEENRKSAMDHLKSLIPSCIGQRVSVQPQ